MWEVSPPSQAKPDEGGGGKAQSHLVLHAGLISHSGGEEGIQNGCFLTAAAQLNI